MNTVEDYFIFWLFVVVFLVVYGGAFVISAIRAIVDRKKLN